MAQPHPNRLQNAHVVVFGGTSGIGLGIASMALSNGSTVVISGSRQPKVDEQVSKLRAVYPHIEGSKISGVAVDLADTANLEANLTALFENVTQGGQKKVDHIAFTAGDAPDLPKIETVDVTKANPGANIRILAALMIAKLLTTGKYVPQAPTSSFTMTGGTNTAKPMPGWSVAASTGGAVEGLTRGFAVDLAPIRVNMVAPGAIMTPLMQGWVDSLGEEKTSDVMKASTLTGSLGYPEDTAEAYGWFMRDRFVTGVIASTDGGRILTGPKAG